MGEKHQYQDFGHSHWHNSLIWGENLDNVSILGSGMIDGAGLWKGLYPPLGPAPSTNPGNKAISLKCCKNVTLRDFSIYRGGHFAILATCVNNLTIDNIQIDTNRDGIDIDVCRNVRITNVVVNSPNDDAIVLKTSFALGRKLSTENITISNSIVSGYAMGTMLDGTYLVADKPAPDQGGATGRIKLGTESNGDFKNIVISNIVFDHSRGLALETVDGGNIEDVIVSNIVMRNITNSPIFLCLGGRLRGPEGITAGKLRRININNVIVHDADPCYPILISGLPGHTIEDIKLNDMQIYSQGGLSLEEVAQQPESLINSFFFNRDALSFPHEPLDVPLSTQSYPEPSMYGILPASGLYIRHTDNIELNNIEIKYLKDDTRPAFVLQNVDQAYFTNVNANQAEDVPTFVLQHVNHFKMTQSKTLADTHHKQAEHISF
ncbi:MAG: right-handed parallel beta-helix repeat-containing protein [Paraglaciecola sp.]|nr:right-handed parallel beta-helix repeat-containing protein [Paraglaciecola sp.]